MLATSAACGRTEDTAPPVATPSVTLADDTVALGSPVEVTYRFAVKPGATLTGHYWVFVHFLDADGELLWTDDHEPATPTAQWKPGEIIEYRRTMFVPRLPYSGTAVIEVGLFAPETGERLPLDADTEGQRAYQVASFELELQTDPVFVVFKDGWQPAESSDDPARPEWQWSRRESTLAFRNPKAAVTLYLQLDQPVRPFSEPQRVRVTLDGTAVDEFALPPGAMEVRKISIPANDLGDEDTVELTLTVDPTFVPAKVPHLKSTDTRELGARVFRAYVDTR